jgi:hypothetical protein
VPHRVTGCYGSALKNFGSGIPSTSRDYTVTQVLEGDRSFGLVVRWKPGYREDLVAVRNIRVASCPGVPSSCAGTRASVPPYDRSERLRQSGNSSRLIIPTSLPPKATAKFLGVN